MPNVLSLFGSLSLNTGNFDSALIASDRGLRELGAQIVDVGKEAIKLGGRFEEIENSIKVFSGSTSAAAKELFDLSNIAKKTTGLRLIAAEEGYQRLRGLGFEASRAQKIIKELGEEKFLSGASDDALNRVFFNFTQIASGGQKISQEIREILTAMPSLRNGFLEAFGTLDPKKIQAFVDANPNAFFDRLTGALEKSKAASGGFNDALGKMEDGWIELGREFAKPILPPLTDLTKTLTSAMENGKGTAAQWGAELGNLTATVNILSAAVRGIPLSDASNSNTSKLGMFGGAFGQYGALTEALLIAGQAQRVGAEKLAEEADKLKAAESEAAVKRTNAAFAEAMATEKAMEASIENVKRYYSERMSIASNFFKVETALIESFSQDSISDELRNLRALGSAKRRNLQSQLSDTESLYNAQITAAEGQQAIISKLQLEKNNQVRELNAALQINEIETQKRIADAEKRALTDRRSAFIDYKKSIIRESQFQLDTNLFNFDRLASSGNLSANTFSKVADQISQTAIRVSEAIRQQSNLQLETETLTAEQRINIAKETNLDLLQLSEDMRRKLLDVTDRQNSQLIGKLEQFRRATSEIYRTSAETFGEIGQGFFNPSTFGGGTLGNLQNVLLKSLDVSALSQKLSEANSAVNSTKQSIQAFRETIKGDITEDQGKTLDRLTQAFNTSLLSAEGFRQKLEETDNAIPGAYRNFEALAKQISGGFVRGFDNAAAAVLKYQQTLETSDLSAEISHVKDLIGIKEKLRQTEISSISARLKSMRELAAQEKINAAASNRPEDNSFAKQAIELESQLANAKAQNADTTELNFRLSQLYRDAERLGLSQNIASTQLYQNSLQGLSATLEQLRAGSSAAFAGLQYNAELGGLREQISAFQEIANLKERIKNYSNFEALEIEKAQLQDILNLRNLETQKIIEGNRSLTDRLATMQAQTESFGEFWGNQLEGSIGKISDLFGNAIENWDGTLKGFFANIGKGFGDMAKQIIADLVRILIYKAILKLVGAFAGGAEGGGGEGLGDFGGGGGGGQVFAASGGYIRGAGTSTSDSIPARLSDGEYVISAKAVRSFGTGFFDRINNMQMPSFATGGMASFSPSAMMPSANYATTNNSTSKVYNINIGGGGNSSQMSKRQQAQELVAEIRRLDAQSY